MLFHEMYWIIQYTDFCDNSGGVITKYTSLKAMSTMQNGVPNLSIGTLFTIFMYLPHDFNPFQDRFQK